MQFIQTAFSHGIQLLAYIPKDLVYLYNNLIQVHMMFRISILQCMDSMFVLHVF